MKNFRTSSKKSKNIKASPHQPEHPEKKIYLATTTSNTQKYHSLSSNFKSLPSTKANFPPFSETPIIPLARTDTKTARNLTHKRKKRKNRTQSVEASPKAGNPKRIKAKNAVKVGA